MPGLKEFIQLKPNETWIQKRKLQSMERNNLPWVKSSEATESIIKLTRVSYDLKSHKKSVSHILNIYGKKKLQI